MAQEEEKEKAKKEKRPTAQKRDFQNEKRRLRNRMFNSRVKTAIRHLSEEAQKGEQGTTKSALSVVYSLMDKGVKKGLYKQNKANRTKARLAKTMTASK